MLFIKKRSPEQAKQDRDISELRRQIEASRLAISSAQNQFEHVVVPTLIDCYIYELNAAQLRYQFLLRSLKHYELYEN
ncbi:MAG: YaaL family protein [Lachnospiraceae bacterium]|nr:YaaL family protein [Lachnospiraceae bacterium]